jgi:hypothetical protein
MKYKLKREDLIITAIDLFGGSLLFFFSSDVFFGVREGGAFLDYFVVFFVLVSIVLYIIGALKNQNGYLGEKEVLQRFGDGYYFSSGLSAIFIIGFLIAIIPGIGDINLVFFVLMFVFIFAFIGFWVWLHIRLAKKLSQSSHFVKRTAFSTSKKKSFYFLYPIIAVIGVLSSLLYVDFTPPKGAASILQIFLIALAISGLVWMIVYPIRRVIIAIRGVEWGKNALYPFLFFSYLIKLVFNVYLS